MTKTIRYPALSHTLDPNNIMHIYTCTKPNKKEEYNIRMGERKNTRGHLCARESPKKKRDNTIFLLAPEKAQSTWHFLLGLVLSFSDRKGSTS
jgi:hypothetical protein